MPQCEFCDKGVQTLKKGLCDSCYARQLRRGTPEYKVPAKALPCSYCGKEGKTVAKGLCNACYYRQKKNGSLEYKRREPSPLHCKVEGCDRPVVSRGYCSTHYEHDLKFGDPIINFGYGERSDHPLYATWASQRRTAEGRVSEWDDFWAFVAAIGDRPSDLHKARRYDAEKPWGPANFYWLERIASRTISDQQSRNEYMRAWRKKNPLLCKGNALSKAYGIDFEQYMQMYEQQGGKCAICGTQKGSFDSDGGRGNTLVVDHCHDKKHVRALLCATCNKGLGHFFDKKALLQKAIDYLDTHRK